jgi:hypothetical protein
MRTVAAELSEGLHSASQQFVGTLRGAVSDGLEVGQLTELLEVAFSVRNQMDAAVSSAIGALDQAAQKAPTAS